MARDNIYFISQCLTIDLDIQCEVLISKVLSTYIFPIDLCIQLEGVVNKMMTFLCSIDYWKASWLPSDGMIGSVVIIVCQIGWPLEFKSSNGGRQIYT